MNGKCRSLTKKLFLNKILKLILSAYTFHQNLYLKIHKNLYLFNMASQLEM